MTTTSKTNTALDSWRMVRRWKRLSGEGKLLWLYLWTELCFGRPGTIWTSRKELGFEHGVDPKSGKRGIDALVAARLVTIVEEPRGRLRLFVAHPVEVIPVCELDP